MKHTWIIFMLLLTISCMEPTKEYPAQRKIINETNFDLEIRLHGKDQELGETELNYLIPANETLIINGVIASGMEEYSIIGWSEIQYATIIFDKSRKLIYKLPNNSKTKALNGYPTVDNGYIYSYNNGVTVYTYTITNEDYENASSCGGSCN